MSDTPTPRTDKIAYFFSQFGRKVDADFACQLKRELAEARRVGMEWALAALKCGLYRADVPHSTPQEWESAQASAACALLDQLEEANANYKLAHSELGAYVVLLSEMTKFRDLLANKEMELLRQLTAHKAALEKCEKQMKRSEHAAYCDHALPGPHALCSCGLEEALAAIKQLKENK